MSKKIHTIQSSDKVEFDKKVNEFLKSGCELMDGGYQVINNDDGVVYSQVIVFNKNCEVEFYENGQLKCFININEDGKLDGLDTTWYENGQKKSEGACRNGMYDGKWTEWHSNGKKSCEGFYNKKGQAIGKWTYYKLDGSIDRVEKK